MSSQQAGCKEKERELLIQLSFFICFFPQNLTFCKICGIIFPQNVVDEIFSEKFLKNFFLLYVQFVRISCNFYIFFIIFFVENLIFVGGCARDLFTIF